MRQTTLTSSVKFSAKHTDPKLLMPTDLVVSKCDIWVTCRGSSVVSKYSKNGELQQSISVPTPTGIVIASSSSRNDHCEKRAVYVASANGTVYDISSGSAVVYISPRGMLTGLAWLHGRLYAVDYQNGYVGIYNGTNLELTIADDSLMAVGYKPYGIKAINEKIYITFTNMSTKQGAGYVDVYDPCGCKSLRRIINRDNLSIPYGLFRSFNDELGVGNAGSGYLSKFNQEHEYTTNVRNQFDGDIAIDGIMGIAQTDDKLYYVTSADGGNIGSLGVLHFN